MIHNCHGAICIHLAPPVDVRNEILHHASAVVVVYASMHGVVIAVALYDIIATALHSYGSIVMALYRYGPMTVMALYSYGPI